MIAYRPGKVGDLVAAISAGSSAALRHQVPILTGRPTRILTVHPRAVSRPVRAGASLTPMCRRPTRGPAPSGAEPATDAMRERFVFERNIVAPLREQPLRNRKESSPASASLRPRSLLGSGVGRHTSRIRCEPPRRCKTRRAGLRRLARDADSMASLMSVLPRSCHQALNLLPIRCGPRNTGMTGNCGLSNRRVLSLRRTTVRACGRTR